MRINLSRKLNQLRSPFKNSGKTRSLAALIFMIMALSLGGCGNKGDLYLPEKDDVEKQQSSYGEKQSKL